MVVPDQSRNLELDFDPAHEEDRILLLTPEANHVKRSPGLMLEDKGRSVEAADKALGSRPRKFKDITGGTFVAYDLGESGRARNATLSSSCRSEILQCGSTSRMQSSKARKN